MMFNYLVVFLMNNFAAIPGIEVDVSTTSLSLLSCQAADHNDNEDDHEAHD